MANVVLPENELWLHTRQQVQERLNQLYKKGYRYVVRDEGMNFLVCFNLKPKKYKDRGIWEYTDSQLAHGAKAAYPFKNEDITEVQWLNASPVLIEDWLSGQ